MICRAGAAASHRRTGALRGNHRWRRWRAVQPALRIGVEWAARVKADAVKLWAVDDVLWWCATIAEELHQSASDNRYVRASDSKRGGGSANLGDEVSNLVRIEDHELMDSGHAWVAHVRRKPHFANATAAQQDAEELVQVSEETAEKVLAMRLNFCRSRSNVLLVRVDAVGWHIHQQRSSTSSVEEID